MNAAGLTFVLGGVYSVLQMPFFQSIVADDEFSGTLTDLGAVSDWQSAPASVSARGGKQNF